MTGLHTPIKGSMKIATRSTCLLRKLVESTPPVFERGTTKITNSGLCKPAGNLASSKHRTQV